MHCSVWNVVNKTINDVNLHTTSDKGPPSLGADFTSTAFLFANKQSALDEVLKPSKGRQWLQRQDWKLIGGLQLVEDSAKGSSCCGVAYMCRRNRHVTSKNHSTNFCF